MTTGVPVETHDINEGNLPVRQPGAHADLSSNPQEYTVEHWDDIPQLQSIDPDRRLQMLAVSQVLPFRVNRYVIDQLIDWNNIPGDPVFQLTFPQPQMLAPGHLSHMVQLLKNNADKPHIAAQAELIRQQMNPHAPLTNHYTPELDGEKLHSMQHKYRDTLSFFPSQGQTCHSYCNFCFRWPLFVGDKGLRFASKEVTQLQTYLEGHPEITDLLVTGGDPMVMKTHYLEHYLEPLLDPRFSHVQTIRIETKALAFWPQRFVTDSDADSLLHLLEKLVENGKQVAIMAHYSHPRELQSDLARNAVARVLKTGATVRSQGPLLANINDNAEDWASLWKAQIRLGIIPHYMFVERDTSARHYFKVPLGKAWEIYQKAIQQVSGLGRTARGPSMSAGPGHIEVQGITEINREKVFVLRMIQGLNSDWVQKPFFAKYDEDATWITDLKPAFGASKFFFEDQYHQLCTTNPWRKQIN